MRNHQTREYSTRKLISTLQTCQGHQRQGKTEELLQTRRDEREITAKYNMRSEIISWNRKSISG